LSFFFILVPLMISSAKQAPRNVSWSHMHTPYMISKQGGKVFMKQVVVNPSLNLKGRLYKTCLIVLDRQGIDEILGMNWMKRHKAPPDTVARIIHLDSPEHGGVPLLLALPPMTNAFIHHTTAQNLEDIPVTFEFPKDLPGMPPD
jgi:hypothetical protein